jgi:hypothetical protein
MGPLRGVKDLAGNEMTRNGFAGAAFATGAR